MTERTDVWVLEREVFADRQDGLARAVTESGGEVVFWQDDWWESSRWPEFRRRSVVFHGSLGTADRIPADLPWRPGAFCSTGQFRCSAWYPKAGDWLVHRKWAFCSAAYLVDAPEAMLARIGGGDRFFVRPDSPLKPFSGRVMSVGELSLEGLDCRFYYDDPTIPVVVAPVEEIGEEWRIVIADRVPITGCRYKAAGRQEVQGACPEEVLAFAGTVATALPAPDPVYVMDLCRCRGALRLLELNPFSGADLYSCDRAAVVQAVSAIMEVRSAGGLSRSGGRRNWPDTAPAHLPADPDLPAGGIDMLSYDDERWPELRAGYRVPIDLRPLLQSLELADDPRAAWADLWEELQHQGDVGEGSFVAVPHLVRIHRVRGAVDWNTYALSAIIELARGTGKNPDVPEWAREPYERALRELGSLGLQELPRTPDPNAVRAIMAILAIVNGARTYGMMMAEFSEEEVLEMEREVYG